MAINSFSTVFEARERKFQTEKIFQGEDVDLVARITNDGVPQDLTGYSVTGYYQPTDYPGTEQASLFYSVNAEISQDKKEVIVHWTYDKDFGKQGYIIWALLTKDSEHVYPVSWKVNLAHSPGYPAGETPEPIPQTLDFSQYNLVNDIWLRLTGGTVDGNVTVTGKVNSQDIKVNDDAVTQVWLGNGAGTADGATRASVAIGYNAKGNSFSTAIGTGAEANPGSVALGFGSKATASLSTALGRGTTASGELAVAIGYSNTSSGNGSIAIGFGANADAKNAIQIGSYISGTGTFPAYNHTPNSVQFFNKQCFQTVGTPSVDQSTSDLILVKERAPWAVKKDELIDFLATDWAGNPDMSKVSLFDIAVRLNQCIAAINGQSIPSATMPSDTTVSHLILTDGTDVEFSGTSIEEGTIDTFLKGQGHAEGSHLVRSVVLGDTVTTIDHHAFSGYWFPELAAVDLSRAPATEIGSRAFYESPKLNHVNIGPSITTIGVSAFSQCPQLKSLTIPATVTSFPSYLADNAGGGQLTITWQGRTKAQVQALDNYSFHTSGTYKATDETWTVS